jgi:hypothetical protein
MFQGGGGGIPLVPPILCIHGIFYKRGAFIYFIHISNIGLHSYYTGPAIYGSFITSTVEVNESPISYGYSS